MALIDKHFQFETLEAASKKDVAKSPAVTHEEQTLELDLIERLRSNIDKLNDLQSRLGHLNTEIQSVLGMDSDKN